MSSVLQWVLDRCRESGGNRSDWAFMRRFEIPSFDEPEVNYLTRGRIVQTPWCAIYLHRFDRPDSRPTLHDHPWSFVSIVLAGGGYIERRGLTKKRVDVRRINIKRATDLHYVESLHSPVVWTLMLVGRRRRAWGYVDDNKLTPFVFHDGESYVWTRFDLHPHAGEFDRALAMRKGGAS